MKNIQPRNDKNQRHGKWEVYGENGTYYKCTFHNGVMVGYDEISISYGVRKTYFIR